jgi:hypothetical protein
MSMKERKNIVLIITHIMFAAGIGQRTYQIEIVVISTVQCSAMFNHIEMLFYGIKDRNLPNNPKTVKMIAVFIV